MEHANLEAVFRNFAGGSHEMDGRQFAKLTKDANLVDKKFTSTDVDLIFAKVKDKSARKISFSQFESALAQIATKKGVSKDNVAESLLKCGGPVLHGTKADFVKFHDDKSTYTGVHLKGGPSTIDAGNGKISDISQLCDRTSADVRGVKK